MAAMKPLTHIGRVENWNYGKPHSWDVTLRETAKFWVDANGTKYRKTDGRPAGATIWTQTQLKLDTVKVKP